MASPVPTTAGRPSSRLTIAAWQVRAAVVGDDAGRPLHDRHPVGSVVSVDQDGAVAEASMSAGSRIEADRPGGDRLADAERRSASGLPFVLQAVGCEASPLPRATAPSPAAPGR